MKEKWQFVLSTGLPPEVYEEMTIEEHRMAVKVWNDMNSKKGGKATY
jgi:hypothetical protein